jgi:hypothetical protein
MNDALYSSVLDGLYISMPSLPGLVLMARLLNSRQNREDSAENTFNTIADMTKLLCSVDLALLEKKHRENTAAEAPLSTTPKKNNSLHRAETHLEEVVSLDKRIRAANESLKASIDENRRLVASGNKAVAPPPGFGVFDGAMDSFGGLDTGCASPWLLRSVFDEGDDAIGMLLRHCTMQENEAAARVLAESATEAAAQAPTEAAVQAPTEAAAQAPTEATTEAPTEAPTEAVTEADEEEVMPARPTRLLRSTRVRH